MVQPCARAMVVVGGWPRAPGARVRAAAQCAPPVVASCWWLKQERSTRASERLLPCALLASIAHHSKGRGKLLITRSKAKLCVDNHASSAGAPSERGAAAATSSQQQPAAATNLQPPSAKRRQGGRQQQTISSKKTGGRVGSVSLSPCMPLARSC